MPALPNFVATECEARGGLVRVELRVPPAAYRNGLIYTLAPDVADALADQLRAAAAIARIKEVAHHEKKSVSQTKTAG